MELNYKKIGSGYPILILHGLYGSSDNWLSISKELAGNYEVYLLDARNHGDSPHSMSHTYTDMAGDLFNFIKQHQLNKPIIIGHSMGGKAAIRFSLEFPDQLSKLIVVDISMSSSSKKKEEEHKTIVKSLLNLNLENISTRQEADTFLSDYIPVKQVRQFLLKNLTRDRNGEFKWKLNLQALEKNMPEIMGGVISLNENFKPVQVPSLFIKGEKSDYLKDEDFEEIQKYFTHTISRSLPAGHWIHVEQPGQFLEHVQNFIGEKER